MGERLEPGFGLAETCSSLWMVNLPVALQRRFVVGKLDKSRLEPERGLEVVGVQWLSRVRIFATPWTAAPQASLSFTISRSLLKLMSVESAMPANHLVLFCQSAFSLFQHQGLFHFN